MADRLTACVSRSGSAMPTAATAIRASGARFVYAPAGLPLLAHPPAELVLLRANAAALTREDLYSHLLRSLCPVTNQPDLGSIEILNDEAQAEPVELDNGVDAVPEIVTGKHLVDPVHRNVAEPHHARIARVVRAPARDRVKVIADLDDLVVHFNLLL